MMILVLTCDSGFCFRVKLATSATSAYLEAIRSHVDPSLQMVVAVLPSNKKDLYDAIKKQCCVDTPVSSQCVTFNVLKKPKGLMSVVSKIAIQLNCKLGGEAWAVQIPVSIFTKFHMRILESSCDIAISLFI